MLSEAESLGYELGSIIRGAAYLFVVQFLYIILNSWIPGSPALWLFFLYFAATILTVANDLNFFSDGFPSLLSQHIRTCVDFAILFIFEDFIFVGDYGGSQRATKVAKNVIKSLGKFLSVLFFVPALYLSNCAFLAAARLLLNLILTIVLFLRRSYRYFCPPD